jgi:nicotinate-nucleotide adenylyltransferase
LFKDSKESVAVYGGSFEPPHFGHKAVVEEALKLLDIDKLIVVPTFLNPFKSLSHATPEERYLLSVKMFDTFSKVQVERYEIEEGKSTPTAQTVWHFNKTYDVRYVIVGADNLNSLHTWYNFEELNNKVTWVIASRAGHALFSDRLKKIKLLNVEADISSTEIRNKNK